MRKIKGYLPLCRLPSPSVLRTVARVPRVPKGRDGDANRHALKFKPRAQRVSNVLSRLCQQILVVGLPEHLATRGPHEVEDPRRKITGAKPPCLPKRFEFRFVGVDSFLQFI
jgi:hypothetical protein